MIVIEPVVSEEKLRALLAEQAESEFLDYKDIRTWGARKQTVELARDVGAMLALGGYLVVGADDDGNPTGNLREHVAKEFDEAKLRQALDRYLTQPYTILSAHHVIDGMRLILIHVAPHRDGIAVFARDGVYEEEAGKQKFLFRKGEVFVRHGTSSERWIQSDVDRVLAARDARVREETRAELVDVVAAMREGMLGQAVASSAVTAFTWQLDERSFDAAAIELLRRKDHAPLRLMLVSTPAAAQNAVGDASPEQLATILDRIVSLAAAAITLDDDSIFTQAMATLAEIYSIGIDPTGGTRPQLPIPAQRIWLEVIGRVEALGALAVRLRAWTRVRPLTLQRVPGHEAAFYANWMRHGLTEAYRAHALSSQADGGQVPGGLVSVAREHVHRLPALRPDQSEDHSFDPAPGSAPHPDDRILDSICQFDALWGLVAMTHGGAPDSRYFYTSFAGYYLHRTDPIIEELLIDRQMRAEVLPGVSDEVLRAALEEMYRMASAESLRLRGFPLSGRPSRRIQDFLDGNSSAPAR